jgi:hypothetical protein
MWVMGIRVFLSDLAMNWTNFAGLGSPLPNGLRFELRIGGTTIADLLDGEPITRTADFVKHARGFIFIDQAQATLFDFLAASFDVIGAYQRPIRLDGSLGMSLDLIAQDDLTGVTEFKWMADQYTINPQVMKL